MKKIILIATAILSVFLLYCYVLTVIERESVLYVESRKKELKKEFYGALDDYFAENDRLMYSEEYSGVDFTPIDMKVVRMIDSRNIEEVNYAVIDRLFPYGRYGNGVSYLFMNYQSGHYKNLEELYAIKHLPWQIFLLKRIDYERLTFFIFSPIAVGYQFIEPYMKSWRPSLEESCEEAYKYIIQEDKQYKNCFNPQNKRSVKEILGKYNRYYYLQPEKLSDINAFPGSIPPFETYENPRINNSAIPPFGYSINYIYNGYYRVYYGIMPHTYKVEFNYYNYNFDKKEFCKKYDRIATVILILIILVLSIWLVTCLYKLKKNNKKDRTSNVLDHNKEMLYNEIIKTSNPQLFIQPYNPEKLAIANDIYSKAIANKENLELLEELLKRIKEEL